MRLVIECLFEKLGGLPSFHGYEPPSQTSPPCRGTPVQKRLWISAGTGTQEYESLRLMRERAPLGTRSPARAKTIYGSLNRFSWRREAIRLTYFLLDRTARP